MTAARWPRFLPDLTYWHSWHSSRGTLPGRWQGMELSSICKDLGVSEWRIDRPWRIELPGIRVERQRGPSEKTVTWETVSGTLTARWTLGPDGDWWQAEYPVKTRADFGAAREVVGARKYVIDYSRPKGAEGPASPALIAALELPRSPLPELFHSFLGWSEGMMLFLEEPDVVRDLAEILDGKVRSFIARLADLPGSLAISPDNLDGRFMTPDMFTDTLAPLYSWAVETLGARGKGLVVQVDGPIRGLLAGLAGCGVECAEGVCGPPQGDSALVDARAECGPDMALWGGIAQDFLLDGTSWDEFQGKARAAFAQAAADPRAVVGVADRVPVDARPERLRELARLSAEAGPRDA